MRTAPTFAFVGSSLALDFANTVANRLDPASRKELFSSIHDVAAWTAQSPLGNALGPSWPAKLRRERGALKRIVGIRDAIHDAFAAVEGRQSIAAGVVTRLDVALRRCLSNRCLQIDGTVLSWGWLPRAQASDQILAPILLDAVAMLMQPQQARVRRCDGAGCGWLFVDRSKAQRRRWCSMADCGNREKARRHYRAHAGERSESPS